MNHEIRNAIQRDADADVKHKPVTFHEVPDAEENHGYTREHYKEVIVLFKKMWQLVVVIFMQVPEQPVHDVFMCEPRNTFH